MAKKKYNEPPVISGTLKDLKGLPKDVSLGEQKKRISANVEAGRARIEGDERLAKLCVTALRNKGEFKRATQGFHTYPARLHPDAAKLLLEALPGESLADPFCGGGTLLVEGLIAGRRVYGSDLNPIATLVATARCAVLSDDDIEALAKELADISAEAKASINQDRKIFLHDAILKYKSWYKPICFNELAALFDAIRNRESAFKPLFQAVFSSLVIKYSMRASDTSNKVVHIDRKKDAVLRAFKDKSKEYILQLRELQSLVSPETPHAEISLSDARMPKFDPVDTIITSPPYPGTYDYLPLQQLRQAWFDLRFQEHAEIGSRRSFKTTREPYEAWLKDTDQWIEAAASVLKPGGKMAIVVGEGMSAGQNLKVAKPTTLAAEKAGLTSIALACVERKDPATEAKKLEYILVFEKSDPKTVKASVKHEESKS